MFLRAGYYGRIAAAAPPGAADVYDLDFATGANAASLTTAGFAPSLTGTNYNELTTALTNELEISAAWGLVVNPSHSNLANGSDLLSGGLWTRTNLTPTADIAGAGPDGSSTADRMAETAVNGLHAAVQAAANTIVTSSVYVLSVAVKPETVTRIKLYAVAGTNEASFLLTGAGSLIGQTGTVRTFIYDIGSGWYRCGFLWTAAGTSVTFGLRLLDAANADSYLGVVTNTLLLVRAQLQLQPYAPPAATPTGTTVVVPAGTCIATRSAVIEGTVLLKGRTPLASAGTTALYCLDDNTTNTRLLLQHNSATGILQLLVMQGGSTLLTLSAATTLASNTDFKLVVRFGANDYAIRYGWSAAQANTATALPSGMVQERLGSHQGGGQWNSRIWRAARWSAKLSDADMQTVLDAA